MTGEPVGASQISRPATSTLLFVKQRHLMVKANRSIPLPLPIPLLHCLLCSCCGCPSRCSLSSVVLSTDPQCPFLLTLPTLALDPGTPLILPAVSLAPHKPHTHYPRTTVPPDVHYLPRQIPATLRPDILILGPLSIPYLLSKAPARGACLTPPCFSPGYHGYRYCSSLPPRHHPHNLHIAVSVVSSCLERSNVELSHQRHWLQPLLAAASAPPSRSFPPA
jgi:hypothetical protein